MHVGVCFKIEKLYIYIIKHNKKIIFQKLYIVHM
jgi:hypothetical protein